MGRSPKMIKEVFANFERIRQEMGLMTNEEKTKYVEVTNRPTNVKFPSVNNYNFQKVIEFKYLVTLINSSNNNTTAIDNRITMTSKCYYGLKNQLQSHYITIQTKCKLYKTLLRPVLLNGTESWIVTKASKNKLKAFERKILRKIYGPTNDKGEW
jgi:uncharacterized Fe-S center protein